MKAAIYIFAIAIAVAIGAVAIDRHRAASSGTAAPAGTPAPAAAAPTATSASPGSAPRPTDNEPGAVKFEDIQALLALLPEQQRVAIIGDATAFKRLVDGEGAFRSVLAAARANNLQDNVSVARLMQRQAERALVDTYLNEIVKANLGADFPKPEQIRKVYDDNRAKFSVPQQVHVWQIFWPVAADAAAGVRSGVEAEVRDVQKDLETGKITFGDAAARYSKHQPSRYAGGYMGLLSVDDLLPEVRSVVADLPEGAISKPIRTSTGYHLVKRGGIVAGWQLEFSEVETQARELLVREAVARLRETIATKAKETYRLQAMDDDVEAWRAKLAGQNPAPAPANGATVKSKPSKS